MGMTRFTTARHGARTHMEELKKDLLGSRIVRVLGCPSAGLYWAVRVLGYTGLSECWAILGCPSAGPYWAVRVLGCLSAGLPECWAILGCPCTGLSECWVILGCQSAGLYWAVRVLGCPSTGLSEYWVILGCPSAGLYWAVRALGYPSTGLSEGPWSCVRPPSAVSLTSGLTAGLSLGEQPETRNLLCVLCPKLYD